MEARWGFSVRCSLGYNWGVRGHFRCWLARIISLSAPNILFSVLDGFLSMSGKLGNQTWMVISQGVKQYALQWLASSYWYGRKCTNRLTWQALNHQQFQPWHIEVLICQLSPSPCSQYVDKLLWEEEIFLQGWLTGPFLRRQALFWTVLLLAGRGGTHTYHCLCLFKPEVSDHGFSL